MSRPKRWAAAVQEARNAVNELEEIQGEYQDWFDSLPEGLDQTPVAEKLEAVLDLDLSEIDSLLEEVENAELPLGFGRD
jgi:hypothetical protein